MSKRWAVLIGINEYHESLGTLQFCANDARLMQETLVSECCGFAPDNIVLLTDDQPKDRLPTFGNIHSWLGTWLSRPGPDDLVLVYFAGHGREANGQALLVPQDATLESMPVTGIPIPYVRDLLDRCPASRKVLILDACHSGAGRDVATMTATFRQALDAGTGLYTIASCDADQISYEWPEKQHGVFTYSLVEALRHGAPVEPDGRVLLDRVYEWARKSILSWTADKRLKQEPVRICRVKGDIHIASRSLSLEQQLEVARAQVEAAKAQVDAHQDTIAELSDDIERLSEEIISLKAKLSRRLKDKKVRPPLDEHTKTVRRHTALGVLYPVGGLAIILGFVGYGYLGLGLVFLGAAAWIVAYRHRIDDNSSIIGGAIVLALAVGIGCIDLARKPPPPFLAYAPGVGPLVVRSYQQTMTSAEDLLEAGRVLEAEKVASQLEENLRNAGHPELAEVHKGILATLETKILPDYYVLKGIWVKNGRLFRWDEGTSSVVLLVVFSSINEFYPSPDGKLIAMLVNDGNQIFVINRDGSGLMSVVPKHSSGYYLDGWSGPLTLTITVRNWQRKYNEKKEVTVNVASEGY